MTLFRSNLFLGFFVVSLMVTVGLSSCKNVKKFKDDRTALLAAKKERKTNRKEEKKASENVAIELEEVVAVDSTLVPELVNKKAEGDSLYLSYERTACYGRCPIYKINVFDSGYATYEGINFVAQMGIYHARLEETTLIDLERTLNDMYFFQLEDNYDNPSLADMPSKIIVVNKPNHRKRIRARYEVPNELIELFDKIDGIIDATEWLPGMVTKN